ncbi:MAG: MerR family transcriptional regulator [Desulfuromonadales bacterium]|nr:MerR family transcriptional regulator [Desulfuromonadales bacterium]
MGTTFPDKLYYKIGEVAQMAGVRTSVLRFWETEFEFLRPEKSSKGQRLYSKQEIDLVLQVRRLLYDEKFTIEGVKKRISSKGRLINSDDFLPTEPVVDYTVLLKEIKSALQILRSHL